MYGEDRPDMMLAKDREWENRPPSGYTRWEDYLANERLKSQAGEFGGSMSSPIREVVLEMLKAGIYSKLMCCSDVEWPDEEDYSICDALTEACIELGLSDEEFSPSIRVEGFEIEIRLI